MQAKTQFQSFTLNLSENQNSTLFNSNVKVTDGVTGDNNEIVNLFVTKPSFFKLGIRNDGTFNQIGISTFNDNVNLVEYVQNPNTSTQKTIIPVLNIATTQAGHKIILYNSASNINFCGLSVSRTLSSISSAFMSYHCNSIGIASGHRFFAETSKILDLNTLSMIHIGKTAVICADSNLNSGFQFENKKANEISLLFKSDISDSISDSSIVVSNTSNFFAPNSGKMVVTSGELELTSNRISQIFSGSYSTSYVNSNQLINIAKVKSIYTNISDVTTIISGSNSIYEDQGIYETRCRTKIHTGTYNRRCILNATTGITDFNDTLNKFVSTNYKTSALTSNLVDASIVVSNNNSTKENGGICNINAGILNLGTNSEKISASTIVIGSTLFTWKLDL